MDLKYLTTCGECGKTYNTYAGLSHHLSREHKDVSLQEYYDKFLRKPEDGVCKLCGKPTKFTGRLNRGYAEHCSQKEWAGRCHPLGWLRNAHENTLGTLLRFHDEK